MYIVGQPTMIHDEQQQRQMRFGGFARSGSCSQHWSIACSSSWLLCIVMLMSVSDSDSFIIPSSNHYCIIRGKITSGFAADNNSISQVPRRSKSLLLREQHPKKQSEPIAAVDLTEPREESAEKATIRESQQAETDGELEANGVMNEQPASKEGLVQEQKPHLQHPKPIATDELTELEEETAKPESIRDLQQAETQQETNSDKRLPELEANDQLLEKPQRQLQQLLEQQPIERPSTREWQILTNILPPALLTVDESMLEHDERFMRMAIEYAQEDGGEYSDQSAYPNPTVGAVLATSDGRVLGQGRSTYNSEAVRACIEDAGIEATPLSEWCVTWPTSAKLREDLASATLYVTLEPCMLRSGTAIPPVTKLIEQTGIERVVIGCPSPIPERTARGAASLHEAGIQVVLGSVLPNECKELIQRYSEVVNNKLHRMARNHFRQFQRPIGILHCSVVDSNNLEAFARQGNAFGTSFGGKQLSYRNFGSYEIAPPPEVIWADDSFDDDEENIEDLPIMEAEFEMEDFQGGMKASPMMASYEQVDAVVATFPREGNGPPDDPSLAARLNGLKWLATHGQALPAGVERILVMDATDMNDLPLSNGSPHLPEHVDVEAFWRGTGRKPTRVVLRRGLNAQARAAAQAAAEAARAAADAAQAAANAVESGDAAAAAEAAIECQQTAESSKNYILEELQRLQELKRRLEDMGVHVDTIEGGEPVDVLAHLGKRHGYNSVVWRAGCWGQRGVRAILAGAFQWVSAHLAVDAVGGRFWQLMLAENAVQSACGPRSRIKILADQEDVSLEYCDDISADSDCKITVEGRPIRHIRLDCRVGMVNPDRPREFHIFQTRKLDRKIMEESAPWFL